MASVRNKINKLVSTPEDDLTAELEIPAFFPDERDLHDQDPEAEANTLEIDVSGLQDQSAQRRLAADPGGQPLRISRLWHHRRDLLSRRRPRPPE